MSTNRERLWRVRKSHTWIDAQIRDDEAGVEVRFLYDGEEVFSRRYPSRHLAVCDTDSTLRDLQRAGWVTHW